MNQVVRSYPVMCPICAGRGSVPHGFYMDAGWATSTLREPCKACGETGTTTMTETVIQDAARLTGEWP